MRSKRFPVVIIFTFLLCGVVAGVSLERYTAKERVLNSITSFIVYPTVNQCRDEGVLI